MPLSSSAKMTAVWRRCPQWEEGQSISGSACQSVKVSTTANSATIPFWCRLLWGIKQWPSRQALLSGLITHYLHLHHQHQPTVSSQSTARQRTFIHLTFLLLLFIPNPPQICPHQCHQHRQAILSIRTSPVKRAVWEQGLCTLSLILRAENGRPQDTPAVVPCNHC